MTDSSVLTTGHAAPPVFPNFPPMYYQDPVMQVVLGIEIAADDQLTASVTSGAPNFRVTALEVCDWVSHANDTSPGELPRNVPAPQPRVAWTLSEPVGTSDGTKPLAVKKGQYARLKVTAEVPQGSTLPVGNFGGVVSVHGNATHATQMLSGSYLGPLIGRVVVTPSSAVPAQPVFVQVLDAQGKPVSDPRVIVTIQGVPGPARYLQYAAVGDRTLAIRAFRGATSESAQATVSIKGDPLTFRTALAEPATTLPMINVAPVQGSPYAATIRLGNSAGARRILAHNRIAAESVHRDAPPAPPVQPVVAARPQLLGGSLEAAIRSSVSALPRSEVVKFPDKVVKTGQFTETASGSVGATPGLVLPPPAPKTGFRWDFGDGTSLTTDTPNVTHDFFPAMRAGRRTQSFDVTCASLHDNVTVKRTVVVHSAYEICKMTGVIVPPLTGSTYATFQRLAFSGAIVLHNLESVPITLTEMAIAPLSDDPNAQPIAPRFTNMREPITIGPTSASVLGAYVALSDLRAMTNGTVDGISVIYSGTMTTSDGTKAPVRFSRALRISTADARRTGLHLPAAESLKFPNEGLPINWNRAAAVSAIDAIASKPGASIAHPGNVTVDEATNTVHIPLASDPHAQSTLMQAQSAVNAGLTAIALKAGILNPQHPVEQSLNLLRGSTPLKAMDLLDPLNPPPVAVGNECFPDDISDADAATADAQELVCQLTNETEDVTIPAQFQNALAGDIILSPSPIGDGDLISALFRALNPPQHHGHSGIMTQNFFEITHCTASVDRIKSNLNTELGLPSSLKADYLQYAWPGAITQSINDTIQSLPFTSPEGDTYQISGFNVDDEGEGTEIIPPLVVKPLPENEGQVRPALRQASDLARSKGATYDATGKQTKPSGCYYSFYSYTKPERAEGFTDPAGADAGWANGLIPSVCSSFAWLSGKAVGLPLVTTQIDEKLSDFSAVAVAGGADVGPATEPTKDGLIFYPEAERVAAAAALRTMFLDQALSQEYGLGTIPGINEAIAGRIADQLLNCFASGNPNLPGDDSWKHPGDGNAVSPDNILFWNPPNYGYAEPVQFLPQHPEQYTVSRWQKVVSRGKITGRVTSNGSPVPNAHVWVYLPGGDTYTAADGTYTLDRVPIGSYALKAQAVLQENGISVEADNGGGDAVTLTAQNPNLAHDIALLGTPAVFRRMDVTFSLSCDHGDANPFNAHGVQNAGPYSFQEFVNPGNVNVSHTYTYDYNGGGYFHIDYVWSVSLLEDISLEVSVVGTMRDDGTNDDQTQYTCGPFNVPIGTTWSGWLDLEHSNGYHNGPAHLTFSVTNNQQTG